MEENARNQRRSLNHFDCVIYCRSDLNWGLTPEYEWHDDDEDDYFLAAEVYYDHGS